MSSSSFRSASGTRGVRLEVTRPSGGSAPLPGRHGTCLSCVINVRRRAARPAVGWGDHEYISAVTNKESNQEQGIEEDRSAGCHQPCTVCRQRDVSADSAALHPGGEQPGYRDRRSAERKLAVDGQERICVPGREREAARQGSRPDSPGHRRRGPGNRCQRQLGLRRQRGHRAVGDGSCRAVDEGERQPSWANWRAFPLFRAHRPGPHCGRQWESDSPARPMDRGNGRYEHILALGRCPALHDIGTVGCECCSSPPSWCSRREAEPHGPP